MKRAITCVLAAMIMAATVPALSQTSAQKDECLLVAKGCANEVDSIQQKVHKLDTEIKKGTRVYTPEELKALELKLKEVNELLDNMNKPGGGR